MRSLRSPSPSLFGSAVAAAALLLSCGAAASAGPEGAGKATLTLAPRALDMAGSREQGMMYMPSSAPLSAERPAIVKKEPTYRAKPRYATITLGSGETSTYAIAFDEPADAPAKIYLDLNANGDLTDDGDGAWPTVSTPEEGKSPQYSGTWVFDVSWASAEGATTRGQYGLNFYRSTDRDSINYYRASMREGKIVLDGKEYSVRLIENDNDGRFNKLYDPSSPLSPENLPKPVWLTIGGDRYDIRGTFGFNDFNYIAKVSDDGTQLSLEPTMRQIRLPQPTQRPTALAAGVEAPDFEAHWWSPDSSEGKPQTFKLSDFRGKKVVVIDMWATWCGPCIAGLPHLSSVAEAVKGQDVEIIALNVFDDLAAYERFGAQKSANFAFRLARDPAGRERDASIAARLYRVSGIPQSYVIDKSGKIVEAVSGYQQGDRRIEQALVNLGIKIDGLKPQEAKPAAAPVKMIPATGMK